MYQHVFRPPSEENYGALRATSLTDWCFFSTVSLFLNEIKYKGKLPSLWIKKGTNAISYAAKYWTELPNKGGKEQ